MAYREGHSIFDLNPATEERWQDVRTRLLTDLEWAKSKKSFLESKQVPVDDAIGLYLPHLADTGPQALAEWSDAIALLSKEIANIEKAHQLTEEPRAIVAPAPIASNEPKEETGLERY